MINFHLQFPIPEFKHKINHQQKIVFVGSCFAESIGELFQQNKFDVLINTHGIQYNPWSIANSLQKCQLNKTILENELFFSNETWNSWEHHSRFSNSKKEMCVNEINSKINAGHNYLLSADWLVITLGSSFAYKHIENDSFVANCHKTPQKQFSKQLFTTADTVNLLEEVIKPLKEKNKNLKIIFTVSPIRYIRDGIIENNLSKARLIDATHSLINKIDNCFYFPSYELILDDLRDYRFFEKDLVHPNQQAIEYVFDKFIESFFDIDSKKIIERIKEITAAKNHRPMNMNSDSYQSFKKIFLEKSISLKKEYAFLNLENEIDFFGN